MRSGTEVRPHKWSNVIDLFDNGWYSAIWGSYEEMGSVVNNRHQTCHVASGPA